MTIACRHFPRTSAAAKPLAFRYAYSANSWKTNGVIGINAH